MVDKETKEYDCPWPGCGHRFKQLVGYVGSDGSGGYSTVVCPRCGNRLKVDSNI